MSLPERFRVVFLDAATFDRHGDVSLRPLEERWTCQVYPLTRPEERAARVAGCHVAVTNKVVFDAELLARPETADLRLIAVAATGTNNVDLAAARRRGLAVCNVAGYSGASVAEMVFNLILELTSRGAACARDVRAGVWERSPTFVVLERPRVELAGKTLGLIGYGEIGGRVARIGAAFGMEVLYMRRQSVPVNGPGKLVSLQELLERSDVLSLHCPLTPETRGLLGVAELRRLKPTAILINTGRGGLVDETALVEALKEKRLAGAGVDVLTQEPPAADHPLVRAAKELDNLLLTPHVAWTAIEARQRLLNEVRLNLEAFARGERRNRVD